MEASVNAPLVEPGLLQLFRVVVGVRLGLFGIAALMWSQEAPSPTSPPFWLNLTILSGTLVYLCWPGLDRRLGRAFLPLALVVSSVAPILVRNELPLFRLVVGEQFGSVSLQLLGSLLFPLVLIAWQYPGRPVLFFALATALLDGVVATSWPSGVEPVWAIIAVRTLIFLFIGSIVSLLVTRERAQRQAVAQAHAQLVHYATTLEQLAISRERNRLARELHDTLAHTLSAVAVQLEAVSALWDEDPPAAREMLDQSLGTTRHGLTETRLALRDLRATPLEDMGLPLAVQTLAHAVAARAGLDLELQVPETLETLPPVVEQSFYRVAQEALENVARHAAARRVWVRLAHTENTMRLVVRDDGRGFDPGGALAEGRFGLQGLRERAALVGGQVQVVSQPGQGTEVSLVVRGWGTATAHTREGLS